MASGYTYKVVDGEITSLKEFALTCARAMGALYTMRDCPMDMEIPLKLEPDTSYYDESIEDDTKELEWFKTASSEEIDKRFEEMQEKIRSKNEMAIIENDLRRDRINSMLEKVHEWEGAPGGLKEFMISQLEQCKLYDVREDPSEYYATPEYESVYDWIEDECRYYMDNIQSDIKARNEEIERTEKKNEWLYQLHESLKNVE